MRQGQFSGEKFRTSVLVPALQEHEFLEVNLDGTAGFGSSFIDEAFGGLVKYENFSRKDLLRRIEIISNEEIELIDDVKQAINDATKA